jgi:hypothetical protein
LIYFVLSSGKIIGFSFLFAIERLADGLPLLTVFTEAFLH